MHLEYQVYEADFVNAGAASSAIKKTLKQLNVSPQIVKRVVVALYEAEVNAIAHAYGGMIYADIEPHCLARGAQHGLWCRHGIAQHSEECRQIECDLYRGCGNDG